MPLAITTPTRISFRQGIVSYPVSGSAQTFMVKTGAYVSLRAASTPVEVAFAHRDTDYWLSETQDLDNVWGPIPSNTDCWLYWDIDMLTGARTFGFTTVEPQHGPTQVPGVADQHWYDTSEMQMKVYVSGKYINVIRVFAGKVINSTFAPLGVGFPLRPYAGSQVEQYIGCTPGHIIVDTAGSPIRRDNGTFFTTESEFFFNGSSINPVRLEATVVTGEAQETMAKYQVVKFSDFGKLNLAEYNDVSSTMIAMLMEDLTWQEVGNVCIQGKITNPLWNWPTVGASLWVSTSGQLTDVDPHVSNAFVYPIGRPPVGRVITPTTIIFDQGLGGKGDRGDPGLSGGVQLANATTFGVSRLSVNPVDLNNPVVVGDNDPRLNNRVLKAGDAMTGPLVLSSDPSVPLGAATKQYVDATLAGIDMSSRVSKAGDVMTGPLVLSGPPSVPLGAATKQYVDNAIAAAEVVVPYDLTLACSNTTTELSSTGTVAFAVAPRAFDVTRVEAHLLTPSTVGSVSVVVRVNGSLAASVSIAQGVSSGSTAVVLLISVGDRIVVELASTGAAAVGLVVTLIGVA